MDVTHTVAIKPITASEGAKRLQTTKLWSPAGEQLVLQLVASDVFESALDQFGKYVDTKPRDAAVAARCGMLLTYAAYLSESTSDIDELAAEADTYFDKAAKLDEDNWEAWMGKATLYGFSQERKYEKAAIKILVGLIKAQEAERKQDYYVYAYLVLGTIYQQQGKASKAQSIWITRLRHFPQNMALKVKLATKQR